MLNYKNVNWKGIKYNSLENMKCIRVADTFRISSKISGNFNNCNFVCDYSLETTLNWEVKNFEIEFVTNECDKKFIGKNYNGKWVINGIEEALYNNVTFIDISLTPFTNTLPIKNINFEKNIEQNISVIYLDVLGSNISLVQQAYKKITDTKFSYKNFQSNFETDILVDNDGFVLDYPNLFKRV